MFCSVPLPRLLKACWNQELPLVQSVSCAGCSGCSSWQGQCGPWRTRLPHPGGWRLLLRLILDSQILAGKQKDNISSTCFIESAHILSPGHLCYRYEGKSAIPGCVFALRYRISLEYYSAGLLQGCLSTAVCSYKTQNGTTHISSLNEHEGSSFIQITSLNIWIHWSLLLHQHKISFQTIDLTFNNQYFLSTCSAFKVIHWTD